MTIEEARRCARRLAIALRGVKRGSDEERKGKRARLAALTRALFITRRAVFDMNNKRQQRFRKAANASRALSRDVRAWVRTMAPIVRDQQKRQDRGLDLVPPSTQMISNLTVGLDAVAALLESKLFTPGTGRRAPGRQVDIVRQEVTAILRRAGFSHREVAQLTDDAEQGVESAINRARHRARARPRR